MFNPLFLFIYLWVISLVWPKTFLKKLYLWKKKKHFWKTIFLVLGVILVRLVNESSFIKYWMFNFGLTTNAKCSNLVWAWTKPTNYVWVWAWLNLAWSISQNELKLKLKLHIKLLSSRSNISTLSSSY